MHGVTCAHLHLHSPPAPPPLPHTELILNLVACMRVGGCARAQVRCPWRVEEDVRLPGAGVTGGYEPPNSSLVAQNGF